MSLDNEVHPTPQGSDVPAAVPFTPPPDAPAGGGNRVTLGLALMLACCLMLAYIAHVERIWLDGEAWSFGFARISDAPPPEGARPARIRSVPQDSLPADPPMVAAMREALSQGQVPEGDAKDILHLMGGGLAESVIIFDATDDELSKVLESGRLPKRGAPEVLGGDFARMKTFQLDGETFTVVGKLKSSVGGAAFAYFLPQDAALSERHFGNDRGAKPGWYSPDTRVLPEVDLSARMAERKADSDEFTLQPVAQTPTRGAYTGGMLLALVIGAVGGYFLHLGIFQIAARRRVSIFASVYVEVLRWPRLFAAMHVLLYGTFFVAMLSGWRSPLQNIAISQFVAGQFTSGGLSYIGDAYASGHILSATVATFYNNYVMQTLLLTFVVSLVPFAPGLIKTLLSFVLTGFTMVPLWTGAAAGYSYHSITMVLELEAYVLACFAVVVWTRALYEPIVRGIFGGVRESNLRQVLRFYFECSVLCGVMLAIAAAYEATTLILIGGH